MTIDPRDALIACAIKYQGRWEDIYNSVSRREEFTAEEVRRLLSSLHCKAVAFNDPEYPIEIKMRCFRPPLALFYRGDLSVLKDPYRILTVVGSRDATEYGMRKVRELCKGAAEAGFIIASGLAKGIDTAALEAAADYPGRAIAILGNGVDYYYPGENKDLQKKIASTGLVMSEYPDKVPPEPRHFPFRNRMLACISQTTLVGEAHKTSGTLITVAYAIKYNRDIGAIPFRSDDETANNRLIKSGAAMVENLEDLMLLLSHSTLRFK